MSIKSIYGFPQGAATTSSSVSSGGPIGNTGSVFIGTPFPTLSLSPEESRRLDELEKDLRTHSKNIKLDAFKRLPKNLRQEIVDEALLNDCLDVFSKDHSSSFVDLNELNNLRYRQGYGHYSINTHINYYNNIRPSIISTKYHLVLSALSTEELVKAHADATLEEAIE